MRSIIDHLGNGLAVDNPDAKWDYRRKPRRESPKVDGFDDISLVLSAGIYILLDQDEIVYIGETTGDLLSKLAFEAAEVRPKFLPKITFNQILIKRVHPDQIKSLRQSLIATYQPRHNITDHDTPSNLPTIPRRL